MQELKGNIRVFCRVRPLLFHGDSNSAEGASITYPTSVESAGRSLDLINQGNFFFLLQNVVLDNATNEALLYYLSYSGQKLSFSYDKVFDHSSSQEDVFVEISQLVQSALDGYKVNDFHRSSDCWWMFCRV